jgi:hypothetical protein
MAPRKIVILRHGEKKNGFELCSTGLERSLALEAQYLGKDASNAGAIFDHGETPDAFFAITLHTLELVSPSAQSWGLPVIDYSSVPIEGTNGKPLDGNPFSTSETVLNARTQQAAAAVLSGAWDGKTVVMVWEHKHIANRALEAKYPNVTLRELFGLDKATGDHVPHTWSGDNYDFFWVVTHLDGTPKFKSIKQTYTGTYANLPQNDWKVPVALPSDCKQEKSEDDDVAPAHTS